MFKNILFALVPSVFMLLACNEKGQTKKTTPGVEPNIRSTQVKKSPINEQIDSLTNLIENDSENAELYIKRAELWLTAKKHVPADHDLKTAVKLDSTNETYLLAYGNHSALINNTRRSKMVWEKCRSLNAENTSCRIKLSELHFFVQEYKKSISYANEVLKIDRTSHLAHFFKGMSLLEFGDTTKAVRSFQNAVENKPDFVRSMEMLASVYASRNDLLAIDYYKAILNVNPYHSNVYFNMAVFYQNRKEYQKSLNYYDLALKADPENNGILYNIGYIYQELKKYNMSIEYFSKAITINNVDYKSYFARGYVYELLGKTDLAIKDYRSILVIRPGYGPATARLNGLNK